MNLSSDRALGKITLLPDTGLIRFLFYVYQSKENNRIGYTSKNVFKKYISLDPALESLT